MRRSANFSFVCKRRIGLSRGIDLGMRGGPLERILGLLFTGGPVDCGVAKGRVLLRGAPPGPMDQGFAIDKCIASKTSTRALVNTGVLRDHRRRKAAAGPCNFCDVALPRKRTQLDFSCLKCANRRRILGLATSALLGVQVGSGGVLRRMIVISSGTRSKIVTARVKTDRVPVARVGGAPDVLKRTSIVGTVRLVPNMRTKVRNSTKLCMHNKNPSRGLVLLSKMPMCGMSRLLNFFSIFAPRTIGGIALFGDSFPTHFNKHLSSIVSIHAGSNSVGGCRKIIDIKLLADGVGFRKPVVGGQASFGVSTHHSCVSLLTGPFVPGSRGCDCCFFSIGTGVGRGFSSHDHLFLDTCGNGSRFVAGCSSACCNSRSGCESNKGVG